MMRYVQNQSVKLCNGTQIDETGVYYHSYFCLEATAEIMQPGSLLRSSFHPPSTLITELKNIFLSLWPLLPQHSPES